MRANIDDYIQMKTIMLPAVHGIVKANLSRLPNGRYHGVSVLSDGDVTEHITYNRGQIVKIDYLEIGELIRSDMLINGYMCMWGFRDNIQHIYSNKDRLATTQVATSVEDFCRIVEALTHGRPAGSERRIPTYFPGAVRILPGVVEM